MVLRPRNGISLCAGGGGLELGLQLAEPGFACRCFVEADPDAQAVLVGGMEPDLLDQLHARIAVPDLHDGAAAISRNPARPGRPAQPFHKAAVWGDVRTFVGDGWRGHIDLVSAGYPCQPFSAAGKRAGSDDPRHLWPDVARIWWETAAPWGFFENVAGHISLGLEAVLRDIWDMGATPAVGLFGSGEVGGTHGRPRVFIVAYRPGSNRWREQQPRGAGSGWPGSAGGGGEMAHANGGHASAEREQRSREQRFQQTRRGTGSETLDHAKRFGRGPRRNGDHGCDVGQFADPARRTMAHSIKPGLEGHARHGDDRDQPGRVSTIEDGSAAPGRPFLSPPGPGQVGVWGHVLRLAPHLAPSVAFRDLICRANDLAAMVAEGRVAEPQAERDLRRMADAMAARSRALRLYGNGVDPLVAGYAWRTLSAAHGLRPLDLETAG